MINDLLFVGVGIVIGAFGPSIVRKIKAYFVKAKPVAKPNVPQNWR
jgi:hypothetical protein